MFNLARLKGTSVLKISACFLKEGPAFSFDLAHCTGYSFVDKDGKRKAKYGVYFGEGDQRNTLREIGEKHTHVSAMIKALILAVKSASPSKPLHIRTDFKIDGNGEEVLKRLLSQKEMNNYKPSSNLLQQLLLALKNKQVTFEYTPAVQKGSSNYVIDLILSDKKFRPTQTVTPTSMSSATRIEAGAVFDSRGLPADEPPADWPVCYTGATFRGGANGYDVASYCTFWPSGKLKSMPFRLSMFPITLFRAQLAAIELALSEAFDKRLKHALVIMNSSFFLQCYNNKWKTSRNEFYPNKFIYDRILALTTERGMEIRFKYEVSSADNPAWKIIKELCDEGLTFPKTIRDKTEYRYSLDYILEEERYAITGKGLMRARVFKKGTEFPAGVIFDNTDRSGECVYDSMPTGRGVDMILHVLRKTIDLGQDTVVLRTDSKKLIKSLKAWLPIWKRNNWVNSLNKPIADLPKWIEVDDLCRKIKVYVEFMEPLTDEDIDLVGRFRNCIRVCSKEECSK